MTKTTDPAPCVGCQLPAFDEARLLGQVATGEGVLCAACESDYLGAALGAGVPDWRNTVALEHQPPVRGVGPIRCEPWRARPEHPQRGADPPWVRDDGGPWRERIRSWLLGGRREAAALRERQGAWLTARHEAERIARAEAARKAREAEKVRAIEARKAQLEAAQEKARKELEELEATRKA